MEVIQEYVLHLNELRQESKLTVEKFCENICDPRQWRRYKSGENLMPQDRFIQFCNRLSISIFEFQISFTKITQEEGKKLRDIHHLILGKQFKDAMDQLNTMKRYDFYDSERKRYYHFLKILLLQFDGQTSIYESIKSYSDLVNYPKLLNKSKFTFVEMLGLRRIAELNFKLGVYKTTDELYEVISKKDFVYLSSNNIYFLPPIYTALAGLYGKMGQIETSLEVTQKGISFSLDARDNRVLSTLYYLSSLNYHNLHRKEEAYEEAKKCIATCLSLNDLEKLNKYNNLFLKEQGYTIEIK